MSSLKWLKYAPFLSQCMVMHLWKHIPIVTINLTLISDKNIYLIKLKHTKNKKIKNLLVWLIFLN